MSIRKISLISLFCGILCILVYVIPPIPLFSTGVNFTVQTMLVVLFGLMLKPRDGLVALLLYLIIGVIGLPVFSGKIGGLGVILGPTGGFLVYFPLGVFLVGIAREKIKNIYFLFLTVILIMIVGLYSFSILWYGINTNNFNYIGILFSFLPFVLVDILKIILAIAIYKVLPKDFLEEFQLIK